MKNWEIRSVLVPFDFSPPSKAALAAAKDAASRWDAQIELLHVRAFPAVYAGVTLATAAVAVPDAPAAAVLRRRLDEQAAGIKKLRLHVLEGDPQGLVARLGKDAAADLIVMGTHGYTGIEQMLMPSIVEAVVREARAPVLSVHAQTRGFQPKRILVPMNFSAHAGQALEKAVLLAREFEAELHLVHVLEPWSHPTVVGDALMRHLEETAGSIRGVRVSTQLASGFAVGGILEAAAAQRSDLIVLAGHSRRVGEEWMIGTTAERVLRHSPVPVLAVPSEVKLPKRPKGKAASGARGVVGLH